MSESLKKVCLVVIAMSSSVSAIALIPISIESVAFLKCYEYAAPVGQDLDLKPDHIRTVNLCNGGPK